MFNEKGNALYSSQKQLPRKMEPGLVITECAGYIFWQLFLRLLYYHRQYERTDMRARATNTVSNNTHSSVAVKTVEMLHTQHN